VEATAVDIKKQGIGERFVFACVVLENANDADDDHSHGVHKRLSYWFLTVALIPGGARPILPLVPFCSWQRGCSDGLAL
jgi:hypothetical protein